MGIQMCDIIPSAEILYEGVFGEVSDGVLGNGRSVAFRREKAGKRRGGCVPDL